MKLNKRLSQQFQFIVSYALQSFDTIGTVFNGNNYFRSFGPGLAHHNLNVAGIVRLPWGFPVERQLLVISRTPVEALSLAAI